jgi:hypothetical protein
MPTVPHTTNVRAPLLSRATHAPHPKVFMSPPDFGAGRSTTARRHRVTYT